MDGNEKFTLTFFSEQYRNALTYLGRVSGKDGDKIKESGLTPMEMEGTIAFKEAQLVLVCKKLYADTLKPECFLDRETERKCYPEKDYHTMYIAEIEKVFVRE